MHATFRGLLGAVLLLPCLLPAQRTIYVDVSNPKCPGSGSKVDPYCAIQNAILAAAGGDTVLVMPGIYKESLDYLSKAIVVRSTDGPRTTVIDAGQKGSGVKFVGGEGKNSVLEGFTIQNGTGTIVQIFTMTPLVGGGILCHKASPTISHVLLTRNTAHFGAGIFGYEGASPDLKGVVMKSNFAANNGGGACFMFGSKPLFSGCQFIANRCNHTGGGLNFRNDSFPTLANCVFDGNYARDMGGGIRAGALSGSTLVHCTFYKNSSSYGGAVAAGSDTWSTVPQTTVIRNSIFWNNSATWGPELALNGRYPSTIDITHSDVQGGQSAVYVQQGFKLSWGAGMLNSDPLFLTPAAGDFHLRHNSPCRDRGDNLATGLQKADFENDPRIASGTTDIGADEIYPHLYHTGNVTPGGNISIQVLGQPSDVAIWFVAPKLLASPVRIPGIAGMLHLDPLGMTLVPLGSFPVAGFLTLPFAFPKDFPLVEIPTQALSGLEFTNRDTVRVR